MKKLELKNVFEELLSVYHNLKAEIIATEVNKGSDFNVDFLIQNKSSFSRPYRRDVLNVENTENDNELLLELSRNGLYDSLPEALFHNGSVSNKKTSYSAKRKIYKEEEKNARSFFSPIENEFFHQRINIEKNERDLLNNFYNLEDDFLIHFWNIDKKIPKEYQLKLIKLLPYSFIISGDLELSRLSLEKILDQKVVFKKKYKDDVIFDESNKRELGVNLVTESKKGNVVQPYLEVTIGPVKETDLKTLVNNKGTERFIESFYSYFIPLELDVVTKLTTDKSDGFVLNGKQEAMIGITTTI